MRTKSLFSPYSKFEHLVGSPSRAIKFPDVTGDSTRRVLFMSFWWRDPQCFWPNMKKIIWYDEKQHTQKQVFKQWSNFGQSSTRIEADFVMYSTSDFDFWLRWTFFKVRKLVSRSALPQSWLCPFNKIITTTWVRVCDSKSPAQLAFLDCFFTFLSWSLRHAFFQQTHEYLTL